MTGVDGEAIDHLKKFTQETESLFNAIFTLIKSLVNLLGSSDLQSFSQYPPGHFSSPIPNLKDVLARADEIFAPNTREIPGLDLREAEQLALLDTLSAYYGELPFTAQAMASRRYYYENDFFSYGDAIILFAMLRHYKPKRIVEIGAGFSSALMLDTRELFPDDPMDLTFVEPNPQRLLKLLQGQAAACHLIQKRLQDMELSVIEALQENDLLFIDSSHVVKTGSDVGQLIFHILPRLKSGVVVHFHDIPWPFEYSKDWLVKGIIWNEAYFLRAFLQYNTAFSILYFNDYMYKFHQELLGQRMPLCLRNPGGSLWLQKVR